MGTSWELTVFQRPQISSNVIILEGFLIPSNSNLVCKLDKSLYGLKQSSRAWYKCLDQYLLFHNFQRLESNASIYINTEADHNFIILTLYVDDCILINNQMTLIQDIKSILKKEFDMTSEGDLHYTFGNAIIKNRNEGWTIIYQQKYLIFKLKEYNMLNCNSISTLMQLGFCLYIKKNLFHHHIINIFIHK